ncbi:bombesin receptor subtype-3-like [Anneissia japonica]|uniref:bombesin receptor subtype-3-like n=1 Tax=Anneissia japonica TaxID=1529436 RepID=UPI0014257107|nr:bombesin receptor subtype-3-like [Anneissia japonica]
MNDSEYESYSNYGNEYDASPLLWQVCINVMELIFLTIGIFGNTLLIIIISANKTMRSAPNYLLVCLAVGDMLLLTLGVPVFVLMRHAKYVEFIHNSTFGCKFIHGCLVVAESVSIGTFTALSVDRYMVIRYRISSSSNTQSYRKYICICIFIWIVALLIGTPIFHQAYVESWAFYNMTTCYPYEMYSTFAKAYQVMLAIFLYIIPLMLILICYSKMAFILMTSIRTNNVISQGSAPDAMMRRRYLARSVLVMILVFAVCWLPWHAAEIVRQFFAYNSFEVQSHIWVIIKDIKYLLIIFSASANPLVLFTVSKQFQKYLRRYFCCKKSLTFHSKRSKYTSGKSSDNNYTLVPANRKIHEKEPIRSSTTSTTVL